MSERSRNLAVGLTVLGAMALLGALIMIFTVLPGIFQGGYTIRIRSDASHDVAAGLEVHVAGMKVGQITQVAFTDPTDPGKGVTFTARIESEIRLPANAMALISNKGLVSSPYVQLLPAGETLPQEALAGNGVLATDGSAVLASEYRGGSDLIPPEMQSALKDLKPMLNDLHSTLNEVGVLVHTLNQGLEPQGATGPATTGPATATTSTAASDKLRGIVNNLDRTLSGTASILGDPHTVADVKSTMSNLAKATEHLPQTVDALQAFLADAQKVLAQAQTSLVTITGTADRAGQQFDVLAGKLIQNVDKLSVLLNTLQSVAAKIDTGDGTAAKLLNDAKLYNNLMEVTGDVKKLLTQMEALTDSWEKNGIGIKIK